MIAYDLARSSRMESVMRRAVFALCGAIVLSSCGERAPYPYPERAHAQFVASCPVESAACVCTWEKITHTMPYEEYEDALATLRETGIMDTRLTRVRTQCLERHPS